MTCWYSDDGIISNGGGYVIWRRSLHLRHLPRPSDADAIAPPALSLDRLRSGSSSGSSSGDGSGDAGWLGRVSAVRSRRQQSGGPPQSDRYAARLGVAGRPTAYRQQSAAASRALPSPPPPLTRAAVRPVSPPGLSGQAESAGRHPLIII